MSGIGNQTFSQVRTEFSPSMPWHDSEHLRADAQGTRLYTHGAFSISGFGDAAMRERQAKWAQGSTYVRQSIDNEFGAGTGARVFQRIRAEDGPDVSGELRRGDLDRIHTTLGRMQAAPPTPLKLGLTPNQQGQAKYYGLVEGESAGEVRIGRGVAAQLRMMLGRDPTDADIRGLGGLPDRCTVTTSLVAPPDPARADPNVPAVGISMLAGDDAFKEVSAVLWRDKGGKTHIYRDTTRCTYNDSLSIPGEEAIDRPTHLGACMVVKQVDTARSLGVTDIHNFASKGRGYNGYNTWARCGGNAPLTEGNTPVREQDLGDYEKFKTALVTSKDEEIAKLARKPDLDVQDFMGTEAGRQFWRLHGFALPLTFNLEDGSKTMATMRDYTIPSSCYTLRG